MWNIKKWWSDTTKPAQGPAGPPSPDTTPLSERDLSEKQYLVLFFLVVEALKAEGRHAEAEEAHSQMIWHAKDLMGDNPLLLTFEAREYKAAGNNGQAEAAYRLIVELAQELADTDIKKGIAVDNLAIFYHELNRYEDAEPLYHRALKIFVSGEHIPSYASTLQRLGVLFEATGRKAQAKECYQQVAAIQRASAGG